LISIFNREKVPEVQYSTLKNELRVNFQPGSKYFVTPAGAWMLAAPTIYAAAQSPHGTTSDRPIPQSSSAKKVVRHYVFPEKF
jgi:hypothetical protein